MFGAGAQEYTSSQRQVLVKRTQPEASARGLPKEPLFSAAPQSSLPGPSADKAPPSFCPWIRGMGQPQLPEMATPSSSESGP